MRRFWYHIDMARNDSKYLLPFVADPKIGSKSLRKALHIFESPIKLWQASDFELKSKLDDRLASLLILARKNSTVEAELAKLEKLDIGYITMYDKNYPKLLAEVPDLPVILFVRGNFEIFNKIALAVVGSRKYTNYGAKVARDLTKKLAENNLVIVSGLALGIDAIAHQAALDVSGLTIGVLGCGLDRIYPVANFQLGEEIIARGGAIVSEFPLGVPPMKQNFPMRNRIIAGLSSGTLVVEAAEDSGSLITAGLALEYNREVFAVPGNIDSLASAGTNKLIKDGAIPVTDCADILRVLNVEERTSFERAKETIPETDEEKKIIEILRTGEKSGDELVNLTKINVVGLNTTLTQLEMKGLIENIGGGRYKLK